MSGFISFYKKTFVVTSFIVLLAFPLSSFASGELAAKKYIEDLGNQALGIIKNPSTPPAVKSAKLGDLVKQSVDVDWISKFVLGRHIRTINEDQKRRYTQAYSEFLAKNYTSKFNEYTTAVFKVVSSTKSADKEYIVKTVISKQGDPDVLVDYRVSERGANSFKIIDMSVEGISLLTTQRSEFNSVITRSGIEEFIKMLKNKAANSK